jgi:hypothetical protein
MFIKIPLTLPSPARGEGFLIPLPRREGLGEGDLGTQETTRFTIAQTKIGLCQY